MTVEKIKKWASFLRVSRTFFDSNGFFEVTTANLVPVGAFEATLDCLSVHSMNASGELHTSPEMMMKCLMAQAPVSIYQICRSFRDDPPGPVHFPEFTMLEFYKPYSRCPDVLQLTQAYFERVAQKTLPWDEMTVASAWERFTGIRLEKNKDRRGLADSVSQLVHVTEHDSWEDIFFKVMITHIEPSLGPQRPTVLTDYPAQLCALLKVNENTGLTERFEIYWHGMEVCNGGTELIDAGAMRHRYESESRSRIYAGKKPHRYPVGLERAMASMPPMAGVAIGLDRLNLCLEKDLVLSARSLPGIVSSLYTTPEAGHTV